MLTTLLSTRAAIPATPGLPSVDRRGRMLDPRLADWSRTWLTAALLPFSCAAVAQVAAGAAHTSAVARTAAPSVRPPRRCGAADPSTDRGGRVAPRERAGRRGGEWRHGLAVRQWVAPGARRGRRTATTRGRAGRARVVLRAAGSVRTSVRPYVDTGGSTRPRPWTCLARPGPARRRRYGGVGAWDEAPRPQRWTPASESSVQVRPLPDHDALRGAGRDADRSSPIGGGRCPACPPGARPSGRTATASTVRRSRTAAARRRHRRRASAPRTARAPTAGS